jgi:signal peptidase I
MIKTLLQIIEWVVFLAIVVLFFLIASPLLPTKTLLSSYVVSTGSMEPTIPAGSVALTKPVVISEINEGDIITFLSPNDAEVIVIHRVIEIKQQEAGTALITKGDNNDSPDNWLVTASLVQGKGIAFIPYIGYGLAYMKTVPGFLLGIGLPVSIFALLQLRKIKEGIEEEIEKRTQARMAHHLAKKVVNKDTALGVILILLLPTLAIGAKPAQALFSSTAVIEGITIQTYHDFDQLPSLDFYYHQQKHAAGFKIKNAKPFAEIQYTLRYIRAGGVEEVIIGEIDNSGGKQVVKSDDLILGTCSNGECNFHQELTALGITVVLIDGEESRTLSKNALFPFQGSGLVMW